MANSLSLLSIYIGFFCLHVVLIINFYSCGMGFCFFRNPNLSERFGFDLISVLDL